MNLAKIFNEAEKALATAKTALTTAKKAVHGNAPFYQRLNSIQAGYEELLAGYEELLADLKKFLPPVAEPSSRTNAVVQETDGNPTQTPSQATQSDQSDVANAEMMSLINAWLEQLSPDDLANFVAFVITAMKKVPGNYIKTKALGKNPNVLTAVLTANGLSCLPTPVQPAPAPTPQPQERVKFVPVKTVAVQTPTDSKSSTKKNGAAQIDEILGKSQPSNTSFEVPDVPPVP
jgi:hypothetical protein